MNERNQIRLLLIITIGLALTINLFPRLNLFEEEAVVSHYSAIYHSEGILEETFTYKLNTPGKRFLFRFWEDPLVQSDTGYPHIELINITAPPGTIRYIKEYTGELTLLDEASSNTLTDISILAYNSEVGAFNPVSYEPGEYTVTYFFKILAPIEFDDEFAHLNLKLASEHIPYLNVRVAFENPGYIINSYSHPPTLHKTIDENMHVFTGNSGKDQLLEFEFLMTPDVVETIPGLPIRVEGVKALTVNANRRLQFEYLIASVSLWFLRLSGFLYPLWVYRIWSRVGREKDYTVPRTLSFIPDTKRPPWLVNLVFKKDAASYDEDGFYATMLDLHLREKLRVTTLNDDILIEVLDDEELDQYESKIIDFLRDISPDGVVTSLKMNELAEIGKQSEIGALRVHSIQSKYNDLTNGADSDVAGVYTVNGRKELTPSALLFVGSFFVMMMGGIFAGNAGHVFLSAAGYGIIPVLQVIMAYVFPSTLFGYWKEDNLREKLQWDGFRRHLSDFSQLDRYGPEDVNMWGQWLVYGTSLGVGEKVAEAMESLDIDFAPMKLVPTFNYWFTPITSVSGLYGSEGSGSGGGGFGGGGGTGGGGGGVR